MESPVRARQDLSDYVRVPTSSRQNPDSAHGIRRVSTGRSTVPYRCTIDVRTPWARPGVHTSRLGALQTLTGPWRPAGGTVRLIFIGGSRFGRPAAPIGAARATCTRTKRVRRVSLMIRRIVNVEMSKSDKMNSKTVSTRPTKTITASNQFQPQSGPVKCIQILVACQGA